MTDDHLRTPPRRAPLQRRERWGVVVAATAPVVVAALLLTPMAILGPAGPGDVVVAALVYGGLVGLAAAFVAVDRYQARQCPRCRSRNEPDAAVCRSCGYDLVARPRYACPQRHEIVLEDGLCVCGRRLQPLATARGVGREVLWMLRIGAWILAFLVGVGLLLEWLSR